MDKLFWLIGSGNFYDDPQIGDSGKIGNHKKRFIAFGRKKLRSLAAKRGPNASVTSEDAFVGVAGAGDGGY